MIPLRLIFYVLYVVLGAVIIVRLAALGPHWETLGGLVLGAALIALGAYRLVLYARLRRSVRR